MQLPLTFLTINSTKLLYHLLCHLIFFIALFDWVEFVGVYAISFLSLVLVIPLSSSRQGISHYKFPLVISFLSCTSPDTSTSWSVSTKFYDYADPEGTVQLTIFHDVPNSQFWPRRMDPLWVSNYYMIWSGKKEHSLLFLEERLCGNLAFESARVQTAPVRWKSLLRVAVHGSFTKDEWTLFVCKR